MKHESKRADRGNRKITKILDVIDKLKIKGDKLLDIGCANGEMTIQLKDILGVSETVGIEISEQRAETARTKGITVLQMDIEETRLPFDDSSFDVILATELIEHLYNPSHLLREIFRCLKPGGNCVIVIPNLASWHSRLLLLLGYQPFSTSVSPEDHDFGYIVKGSYQTGGHLHEGGKDHIRLMTLRAFKELVTFHGFRVKYVGGLSTRAAFLNPPLGPLFRVLETIACIFPGYASFILAILTKPPQQVR